MWFIVMIKILCLGLQFWCFLMEELKGMQLSDLRGNIRSNVFWYQLQEICSLQAEAPEEKVYLLSSSVERRVSSSAKCRTPAAVTSQCCCWFGGLSIKKWKDIRDSKSFWKMCRIFFNCWGKHRNVWLTTLLYQTSKKIKDHNWSLFCRFGEFIVFDLNLK